ncbi:MAG: primosomal protein N' [Candidatus Saccharibacteria bacterium]|nr:primosomal protein N' [Candidatus Saccharibacteria bacterium]
MNYYEVSMIGNVGAYYDVLTYQFAQDLAIGTIVEVPVGKKASLGVVVKQVSQPDFTCKDITKAIIDTPLPAHLIKLHGWLSDYYATSSGIAWQTILPARIAVKPRTKPSATTPVAKRTTIVLNDCQQSAVERIRQVTSGTILLHGITGSGKTEVYKTIAQDAISNGKSAIILVPEISLTTQLVQEFQSRFGDNVVVTHSAMTTSERNAVWRQTLTSDQPLIVIGPRSALFMPVQKLGLIVIDESHEPSYKQETSPRYHASTVASKLAQLTGAQLILGSATPTVNDYYLAQHFKRPIITINQLARTDAVRPKTKIIDLTNRDNFCMDSRLFTAPLLDAMRDAISNHRQVLLFHNRRGTASLAICQNCGWMATCPRCYTPLTLHGDKYQLFCHICGYHQKPPLTCPDCNQADIVYKGIGTKKIEEEAKKLFPHATIRRFDSDSAKGEAVHELYDELKNGSIDIIIGTQTIAKGLDLPNLAVVGIVQADAGLALPDFSASERTFQLIAQACGRVGRSNQPTTAVIQSYQPATPAVKYGANQDYTAFYNEEIQHRHNGHFPPYSHLLKLSCAYKTERGATVAASKLASELRRNYGGQIKLLGPAPAFYERMRGLYRWQIIIRASQRPVLTAIAADVTKLKANWQIELDPISLI